MRYHRLLLASLIATTAALAAAACSKNESGPSSSCAVTVGAVTTNVSAAATTGSIPVTSSCSWTAGSSASFLTITSGATGTGNGTVNYSIAANSGAARSGSIAIGTALVSVTQDGGIFASFSLFDAGQTIGETNVCQFRSTASLSTTCVLRSTSFSVGAAPIVNYEWTVQYTYATVKTINASGDSPTVSFTDMCGVPNGGSTDDGALQPLDVTLTVTDSLGNKSTAKSGTGS